jgi:capsular polysaccharide transport system permease protein
MTSIAAAPKPSFWLGFKVQMRVIGALLLRELHTRYGRDNVGYLWMVGEPLMLGGVIALLHSGQAPHDGVNPVAFTVIGYCIFIMFRGIVNRSDGAYEGNIPLLYHRMVTMFDVSVARALLEAAGTFMSFVILSSIITLLGYTTLPARPLWLLLGIFYVLWISMALSLIVVAATYENTLIEKVVHPFTYFMIPISASFYQVQWVPQPYRDALLWIPLPHMFEIARYGQFADMTLEFVDIPYVTGVCLVLTLIGLLMMSTSRRRIHLR